METLKTIPIEIHCETPGLWVTQIWSVGRSVGWGGKGCGGLGAGCWVLGAVGVVGAMGAVGVVGAVGAVGAVGVRRYENWEGNCGKLIADDIYTIRRTRLSYDSTHKAILAYANLPAILADVQR